MIGEGDQAPDFELLTATGEQMKLSDHFGKSAVVLFFYPKDDSPGCTAEVCHFRDSYDAFTEAGAKVIGISSDSVSSHAAFGKKHGLPMTLLSDSDGEVRKKYGVRATLGILPGRVTFVVDKKGVVQHAFSSQLRVGKHVDDALAVVKRIA